MAQWVTIAATRPRPSRLPARRARRAPVKHPVPRRRLPSNAAAAHGRKAFVTCQPAPVSVATEVIAFLYGIINAFGLKEERGSLRFLTRRVCRVCKLNKELSMEDGPTRTTDFNASASLIEASLSTTRKGALSPARPPRHTRSRLRPPACCWCSGLQRLHTCRTRGTRCPTSTVSSYSASRTQRSL